jgi:hypothetical protein
MWHDVKALNATASGLFALTVLACMASGVWWVSQRPMFNLRTIRIETISGDEELKHVNHLTLRNNAWAVSRATSSPPTWMQCARRLSRCPGYAVPPCGANGRTS